MTDCRNCKRTDVKCCTTCERNSDECNVWHNCGEDCPKYIKAKQTNADRIRKMTDEELAEFLFEVEYRRSVFGNGAKWKSKEKTLEYLQEEPYVAVAENATPIKDSIMNHFMKGE